VSLWSSIRALFSADASPLTFDAPSIDNVVVYADSGATFFPGQDDWTAPVYRVDRRRAMQCASVVKARDAICTTIGSLPLFVMGKDFQRMPRELLEQPERGRARSVTMTRLVEDLLFEGHGWWRVVERDYTGYPTKVVRLDPRTVTIREGSRVFYRPDGTPQGTAEIELTDAEVIHFESPKDPLLQSAARAIRTLAALDVAESNAASSPASRGFFYPKEGYDPAPVPTEDDPEPAANAAVEQMLADVVEARRRGVDIYLPAAVGYESLTYSPQEQALAEARNSAVLELARFTGLDPSDLAADPGDGGGMTYQNIQDKRRAFIDGPCAGFVTAIQDRLSLGDVTPRGQLVRLDVAQYERADMSGRLEEYQLMRQLGLIDREEILRREELPTPTEDPMPAAAPAAVEPGRPRLAIAASADDVHTFSETPGDGVTLGFASDPVAVDVEARTIRGLAVPWDQVAVKNGRRFSFSRGSVAWPEDIRRVKVLRDHNRAAAVGRVVELTEDETGLHAVLKIARGPAGDEVLALAEDGVLDGLSIGVTGQFERRAGIDRPGPGRAQLAEVTLTGFPAFDSARISSVAASTDDPEVTLSGTDTQQPDTAPAPDTIPTPPTTQFSADDFAAFQEFMAARQQAGPEVVPAVPEGVTLSVDEALPYAFDADRGFLTGGEYDFASDLWASSRGDRDASQRVLGFMGDALEFAVTTTNAAALNPSKQRPDLYVDQRQYQYPLWAAVRKESLTEITPIVLPKYNAHSGLVAAHTEGTEPAAGSFSVTSQTITPGALSGKAEITRELYDQSGPRVSNLIWQKMLQGWFEALEAKVVATLVAAAASITDITLTTAGANKALSGEFAAAVAALQYIRGGYTFDVLAAQIDLYTKLATAVSDTGEPLFPQIAPNNRNGNAASKFASMNVHGVDVFPEWALAATGTVAASSWLIDRSSVWAAASAPNRLDWNFGATVQTNNITQLAYVTVGIWGYSACAILDTAGLRELIYDPV
jgi:HK97 family phage portal protein/HK97 family phage prohead protease